MRDGKKSAIVRRKGKEPSDAELLIE
jgi:hypothetical protein